MMKSKNKYISLSHWIDQSTPTYGNQGGFYRKSLSSIKEGKTANSEKWIFNNHIGTHIDFPKHFNDEGLTSSNFKEPFFISKNVGFIILKKPILPKEMLKVEEVYDEVISLPKSVEILLLKTHFENYRSDPIYWRDNPGFDPALSELFRSHFTKLKIFGFDTISLTSLHYRLIGKEAHISFLTKENPILIIEDMSLARLNLKSIIKEIFIAEFPVSFSDGSPVNCIAKVVK